MIIQTNKPQNFIKMIDSQKEFGSGIYTIPDIHLILGFPPYKIRRYIKKYWDNIGKKIFNKPYTWEDKRNHKIVPFVVLIELYTFFELLENKMDILTIAKARETMVEELNTPYPFASCKFLYDRHSIWYYVEKDLLVNADHTKQTNFVKVIECFAKNVKYENDMAFQFYPLGEDHNILVDPKHQFGQPVINKTNIITDTIFSMLEAGEKKETLSTLYEISIEQINDVIAFHTKKAA